MSTGDSLQQAWQWLVPPVVGDGRGGLMPRKRRRSALKPLNGVWINPSWNLRIVSCSARQFGGCY
jgi:hypothetical protein